MVAVTDSTVVMVMGVIATEIDKVTLSMVTVSLSRGLMTGSVSELSLLANRASGTSTESAMGITTIGFTVNGHAHSISPQSKQKYTNFHKTSKYS